MPKEKPKLRSIKNLKRYIVPSDNHHFIGRIGNLSIVSYNFESYEEASRHEDCKHALDVNEALSSLTRRVESLNIVGDMLWPQAIPDDFKNFPISRYDWLRVTADVFLMRYISVVDCALLLANEVYQLGLESRKCSIDNLIKRGLPQDIVEILQEMITDQGGVRVERNTRFHHGEERSFTEDDTTFRMAATVEHRGLELQGTDRFGRKIDKEKFFQEGIVNLQRKFNHATRKLVRQLDKLYDEFRDEFERRFSPLFRKATHDFGSRRR